MKITNTESLPEGLVRAISNDPYSNEGSDVTASSIGNPPLMEALKRIHEDEIEEDASSRLWSLLGQAAHVIADRGAKKVDGVISERRFFADVLGWKLSGAIDHFDPAEGLISDLKVTSAFTIVYGDRIPEWEAQQNVLAFLVDHELGAGTVKALEIVAILRDWSERDVERVKGYPKNAAVVIPLKLWEPEKRLSYIEGRIKLHQKARSGILTPCTDEERWVKKDKHTGEKTYVRCGKYCAVSKFCPVLADEREEISDLQNKLELSLKAKGA